MTKDTLIKELKDKDEILPQELLSESSIEVLTKNLATIFESEKDELMENARFRNNFTETVNYVYLSVLSSAPDKRNKKIFSDNLITFLLDSPQPAT